MGAYFDNLEKEYPSRGAAKLLNMGRGEFMKWMREIKWLDSENNATSLGKSNGVKMHEYSRWQPAPYFSINAVATLEKIKGLKMADEKYQEYLASREWGLKKEAVKKRANGICERCRKAKIVAVHHKTYARIYHENLEDLLGVCNPCHDFLGGISNIDPSLKKIYLAGKVGSKKYEFAESLSLIAEFISSDEGATDNHGFPLYPHELGFSFQNRIIIKDNFIDRIGKCDFLLAYFDSSDSYGSIAEIAYASAIGKTSLLYFDQAFEWNDNKFLGEEKEEMRDAYWFVCNFPNVYVSFCLSDLSYTLRNHLKVLSKKIDVANILSSLEIPIKADIDMNDILSSLVKEKS